MNGVAQRLFLDVAQDVQSVFISRPSWLSAPARDDLMRWHWQGAALDDMSRGQPVGFSDAARRTQLVPLLKDEIDVDAAAEQRLQHAVIGVPIDTAKHLVGQIFQSGHEVNAKQCAKAEEMLDKAIRI